MASQARACPWGQSPGAGTWGWPQTLSITLRPAPSLVLTTKCACGVMVTPSGRDAAGLGRTARASAAREATGDASPSSPLPFRSSLTPRLMASRSCATTSGRFSNTSTKAACWCVVSGLRSGRFRTAVGRWCALPSSRHGAGARTRTSLSPSSPKAPPCFCKCCCMSIRNVPFAASSPVSSSSSSDAYCRSSAGAMLLRRAVRGGEGEWCATPTSPPRCAATSSWMGACSAGTAKADLSEGRIRGPRGWALATFSCLRGRGPCRVLNRSETDVISTTP